MKGFKMFFEIGGKKMQTTVIAENENQAKQKIKDKIIFHKIEEKEADWKLANEMWKNIFGTDLTEQQKQAKEQ